MRTVLRGKRQLHNHSLHQDGYHKTMFWRSLRQQGKLGMPNLLCSHGRIVALTAAVATGVVSTTAQAEQVIDRALSDVSVMTKKSCSVVRVGFNFRVRYVSHFPVKQGTEMRVRVEAIDRRIALAQIITKREGLKAPQDARAAIRSIEFETRQAGGPTLTIQFKHAVSYKVAQGGDFQSIVLAISGKKPSSNCLPVYPRQALASPWTTTVEAVDRGGPRAGNLPGNRRPSGMITKAQMRRAAASIDESRAALKRKRNGEAIRLLSKVLRYPEHEFSAEAQELLGLARKRNGQIGLARAEYEDYLRRYGSSEDAERVRQRLDAIAPPQTPKFASRKNKKFNRWNKKSVDNSRYWSLSGSLSQFYVRDDSFRTFIDPTLPPEINQNDSDHRVYQNSLLSSLNVTATWNNEWVKNKIRFSGTQEHDFDGSKSNIVGVASLYTDTIFKKLNLQTRLGRQTRNTGGVLGRFDGGVVSWQASEAARLNVVAGSNVSSRKDSPFKHDTFFYGASIDVGSFYTGLDTSVFAIEQRTEGYVDRRAIGFEARYFDTNKSAFLTTDYDVHFNRLNTFLFNGSWTTESKSTFTAAFDYRTSPNLLTSNALQGQTASSLDELRRTYTKDQIEQFALDRTAIAKTATVGFSRALNSKYQVSLDATVSNISGTKTSGGVEGTLSTGTEVYYGAQLIANDLFTKGDISVAGIRFADRKSTDSWVLDLNTRYPITKDLRINPRVRFSYQYSNVNDMTEFAFMPSTVLNYYVTKDLSLEFELGGRFSKREQAGTTDRENEIYFTLGYRYDFYAENRENK